MVEAVMRADAALHTRIGPGVVASRVINDPKNATDALAGASTS